MNLGATARAARRPPPTIHALSLSSLLHARHSSLRGVAEPSRGDAEQVAVRTVQRDLALLVQPAGPIIGRMATATSSDRDEDRVAAATAEDREWQLSVA